MIHLPKKESMFEEAKQKFENHIKDYKARIEMWEKVERVYKKDGTEFKNLSQNFTNCKFETYLFHPVIKIYYKINNKCQDDYISIRQLVKYSSITPKPEQIIKETYAEDYFFANAEQLEELIKNQIEKYQEWLKIEEEDLKLFTEKFDKFYKKLEELKEIAENTNPKVYSSSSEYRFLECIKEIY